MRNPSHPQLSPYGVIARSNSSRIAGEFARVYRNSELDSVSSTAGVTNLIVATRATIFNRATSPQESPSLDWLTIHSP